MSSHHVVRNEQEPALFIIEPKACDFAIVQELLEWNPTIIVLESAVETVLSWGIKIDVVICHLENFDAMKKLTTKQSPVEILAMDSDLIANGVNYLKHRKHKTVSLLANFEQAIELPTKQTALELVLYNQNFKAFWVKEGVWKKWASKGTNFKIYVPNNNFEARYTNLVLDKGQNHGFWHLRTERDDFVEIDTQNQPFWLFEQLC
ncbi:MAG: type I restriction enzyme HsdR N-terminal domain-containing protein [Microscillaceae bacterium]|nr:type I restriction enzyme HsdR N-terminal domain-containing protein [Microscillaceae bacterium]MDW8459853.1 hypothetical protein [Cytophagales bacterium]